MSTAPTTEFRQLFTSTAATAIDSAGERATLASSLTELPVVDAGTAALDFGSVSISEGAANSSIQAVIFRVSSFNDTNSVVDNMRFWVTTSWSSTTTVQWKAVTLGTEGSGSLWVQNPVLGPPASYIFNTLPTTDPGTSNLLTATGELQLVPYSGVAPNQISDWTQAIVMYIAVAADEQLGTYTGTGTNKLQFNLKFDFS
jgi:hypothetical protein